MAIRRPSPVGCIMKGIVNSMPCANTSTNVPHVAVPHVAVPTLRFAAPDHPPDPQVVPPGLPGIRTPVSVQKMSPWLNIYPDRVATEQLRSGFSEGFFIPFYLPHDPVFSDNLKSARDNAEVLHDKVSKEVSLGRILGPFTFPPLTNLRVSPLGVVPEKEAGKFHLIQHLSFPKGSSVNDGISKEDASVSYVSFDRAVALVRQAGVGALMAKSDIESAFRLLPVHTECHHLLGCQVDGLYYYDACLPMGCSISCHFFLAFQLLFGMGGSVCDIIAFHYSLFRRLPFRFPISVNICCTRFVS